MNLNFKSKALNQKEGAYVHIGRIGKKLLLVLHFCLIIILAVSFHMLSNFAPSSRVQRKPFKGPILWVIQLTRAF